MRVLNFIRKYYARITLFLFIPIVTIMLFSKHDWVDPDRVIAWDIKNYYGYLPAAVIFRDLDFKFRDENPERFRDRVWAFPTEKGKKVIVMSMGLSFLYLPFFLIAHLIALFTDYLADGYSVPYAFALQFSALFYTIIGLFYLLNTLRRYFSEMASYLSMVMVFVGTNLLFYTSFGSPMPHAYNFALISVFIHLIIRWYENPNGKQSIYLGLVSGLISLIRPTNIIVLLLFVLWEIKSIKEFNARIALLLKKWPLIVLMAIFFILVWSPQLAFWKYATGKLFYFSYELVEGKFYWTNPQFFLSLFSFRKGWLIYTPLMFFALLGFIALYKQQKGLFVAMFPYTLIMVYLLAAWWCWWFGGAFGQRSFIDFYGVLAFPLASLIQTSFKRKWFAFTLLPVLLFLTWYNTFQIKQYNRQCIHYWWHSRHAYMEVLFKSKPTSRMFELTPRPDYPKARLGVYVSEKLIKRIPDDENPHHITPIDVVNEIKSDLYTNDSKLHRLEKYADRHSITLDSAVTIKAYNIYELRNIDNYVESLTLKLENQTQE